MLPDGIYTGWVRHRRYCPGHSFRYPLAMLLLDLDQLPQRFRQSRWWSLERFNAISFFRRDYLAAPEQDLKQAVVNTIARQRGESFSGTVKILTHPRYFGVVFNPVSFYLCYGHCGTLQFIVTEINNTPWNQRHCYVLPVAGQPQSRLEFQFEKQFHVSPFMPMGLVYHWRFHLADNRAVVHMTLLKNNLRQFTATMKTVAQQPFTGRAMALLPLRYPMQTALVALRIYWQALQLWRQRAPFFNHPGKGPGGLQEQGSGEQP